MGRADGWMDQSGQADHRILNNEDRVFVYSFTIPCHSKRYALHWLINGYGFQNVQLTRPRRPMASRILSGRFQWPGH